MQQLLGLFNHYDLAHPLWAGEPLFTQGCEMFCVSLDRYDQDVKLEEICPDAILCDTFLVPFEMASTYPTIFYLAEDGLLELEKAGDKEPLLQTLRSCREVLCFSVFAATLLRNKYGILAKVQHPCVIDQAPSEPRYVYYDPGFPLASKLQAALPREEFRALGGLNDLGLAKVYISLPPEKRLWQLAFAVAAHRLVPCVSVSRPALAEFTSQAGLQVSSDAGFDTWLPAVRACLRDRSHFAEKLKGVRSKYRDMRELSRSVREALKNRPEKRRSGPALEPKNQPNRDSKHIINQRRRRTPVVPCVYQNPSYGLNGKILITGGIGDVFAVESFFSDEQRVLLTTILYATHKSEYIKTLFDAIPTYPHLKYHKVIWSDFSNFWCFCYKEELIRRMGSACPQELRDAEDWGIVPKFPVISVGMCKYNGSSFIKHKLADVDKFRLPQNYVVIQPYSTDKRVRQRDYNDADWIATLYWLKKRNMKGVVINKGSDPIPEESCLINLANQTTVLEAAEILKCGKGYVGIDSWLTVLAAKLFDNEWIGIKSINSHCYSNKHIYYAPKTKFDFISQDIVKALKF